MRSAIVLALGIQLAAAAPAVLAQGQPAPAGNPPAKSAPAKPAAAATSKPSGQTPSKPAAAAPAQAGSSKPAAAKPQPPTAKPASPAASSKPPAAAQKTEAAKTAPAQKPAAAAKAPARHGPPKPKAPATAKKPVEGPADTNAESEAKVSRRDPFESLVARQQQQARSAAALPPGIHGLQVSTLRLDGIVKSHNGMIAVVSNPQARTYFLREGDQLYDGTVDKIAMDGVSFHEIGKDAFGKPVERQVNKRIYSSAGEQQ
jgi:Tfp pilus assembly protein PilP